MSESLEASVADVQKSLDQGDLLKAFDQACEHLDRFPDSETLKHKGLLALADAGATERAKRLFKEWKLDRSEETDFLALEARLAKDAAIKLGGAARRAAFLESAEGYRRFHEKKRAYYTKINWASMSFLGRARDEAARLAREVLADPEIVTAADYWALATRAEANLLAGLLDAAKADLQEANRHGDTRKRMRTRLQLRLILAEQGFSPAETARFLAPLSQPLTLHYAGTAALEDAWSGLSDARAVASAEQGIGDAVAKLRPSAAFGSLGSPTEILFAEQVLAAGAELRIILPMPEPAFREMVLANAGESWLERFDRCCKHEKAHVFSATDDPYADDPSLADYADRIAMGRALLWAQYLDGEAVQVVLADGPAAAEAGRPAFGEWGDGTMRRQVEVPLDGARKNIPAASIAREPRPSCAVVFGDLPGFSRLPEKYLPKFWDTVMKAVGDVVQARGKTIALKNTWGDAIHLVIPDVRSAAEVCLSVQRSLAQLDGKQLGRDEPPTMRIGAHYGPVFRGWDPIVGSETFYGRALSRAARIEPITPPGTVYVTEAFAAILLLESRGEFTCTYVGQVPLAKGFGTFRMYDLAAKPEAGAL
jgi:adenylate cyclase